MPQLIVRADDFTISSYWSCSLGDGSYWIVSSGPTLEYSSTLFEWDKLKNAMITEATIHVTPIIPNPGGAIYVNNTLFNSDDEYVPVSIDNDDTSLNVQFAFRANSLVFEDTNQHHISATFTDVYLLIEYDLLYTPPELLTYTDPNLVKGETYVKAIHMTELHTNINRVRVAHNLSNYTFTSIVSGTTSLGGWNDHVLEMRAALDEIGKTNETWITLGDNCPRADVLTQLRNVTQTIANG